MHLISPVVLTYILKIPPKNLFQVELLINVKTQIWQTMVQYHRTEVKLRSKNEGMRLYQYVLLGFTAPISGL